jgi:hypothetical protein
MIHQEQPLTRDHSLSISAPFSVGLETILTGIANKSLLGFASSWSTGPFSSLFGGSRTVPWDASDAEHVCGEDGSLCGDVANE